MGGIVTPAPSTLGINQTWHNVTGSRASGSVYTNTTGRAMMVIVSGGSSTMTYTVDSVSWSTATTSYGQASFVVPPNSQYSVANNFQTWGELY
jgi:hypothetical protein